MGSLRERNGERNGAAAMPVRSQVLRRKRALCLLGKDADSLWDSGIPGFCSTLGCCGSFLEGRDLRLGGEVGQTPQISRDNFKGARFGGPDQECMGQAGWLRSPSHGMLA